MASHQEIVSLLGVSALADGIGRSAKAVSAWKNRDSIPGDAWFAVVKFAADIGHPEVTLELLAEIAAGTCVPMPAPPASEPSASSPDGAPAGADDFAPAGESFLMGRAAE